MSKSNLNEKMQSAYRAFHSTETALTRVQSDILMSLDNKRSVLLILLDLSAAFDTIDHNILFNLLSSRLGVKGTVLKWFKSYLTKRTQSIAINGKLSSPATLHYGVPQGSVLGPLLYTIYTLPLGNLLRQCNIPHHFYADDTQLYLSCESGNAESLADTLLQLEHCVTCIKSWMVNAKLKLNDEKTEVIMITSPHCRNKLSLSNFQVDNTNVIPASSVRNIGAIFDNSMSMKTHINNVCKSVSFHLHNIGKVRKYITRKACEQLVHSLVSSRIDYANSLLFGVPESQTKRLQHLFSIAARIITLSSKTDHITPILRTLHWLPVKQRIVYKILLLTFKSLHGQGPEYLEELLIPFKSDRSLRSSSQNLLAIPKTRCKTLGDRSFAHAAPVLWNSLPLFIRCLQDVQIFKSEIKTYLFKQAFST